MIDHAMTPLMDAAMTPCPGKTESPATKRAEPEFTATTRGNERNKKLLKLAAKPPTRPSVLLV
jgi:hypothetical protein